MKRGTVSKKDSQMVTLWLPQGIVDSVNKVIQTEDSDRSKFIRRAVREKLQRMGILTEQPQPTSNETES